MIWDCDPVAIALGPVEIRWYGLVYIAGFLLTQWLGRHWLEKKYPGTVTKNQWENLTLGIFFAGIIGGRIGEFVFFQPNVLLHDPLEVFKIWHGGMSIHGGLLGAVGWGWWWCRKNNINPLIVADAVVLPLAITLIAGRAANWCNGELWGRPTGRDWGVIFPHVDDMLRHPSQLYESTKNMLLSALLGTLAWKKQIPRPGTLTGVFILGYGSLRLIIQLFWREPTSLIAGIPVGGALSAAMILLGAALIFWPRQK